MRPEPPVADQAHGLPLQTGEFRQSTGKENGAQIGDVVAAGLVPLDEPVVGKSFQHGVVSIRGRDSEQVEIGRIVQDLEDILAGEMLGGDAVFEGVLQQEVPELPFFGRVVSQLSCRAADADERGTAEGHRLARRAFDLEQYHPRSIHQALMEPEVDLRVEKPRQPRFDELVPLPCGTRNEVRSHEFHVSENRYDSARDARDFRGGMPPSK